MIFGTDPSPGGAHVPIYGFVVAVSKWTAIAPDDDAAILPYPTYGEFAIEKRLKFLSAMVSSSIVGMSYGSLALVLGEPTTSISAEDAGDVLGRGDRVLIGVKDDPEAADEDSRWIWAGYCTRLQMTIGPGAEQVIYRLRGPEWIWGEGGAYGASRPFIGQIRRQADKDDDWAASAGHALLTFADELIACESEPAIFNPGGRANMTVDEVELNSAISLLGHVWESADRKIGTDEVAIKWTVKQALKLVMQLRNDPAKSGIDAPDFEAMTQIADGDILRQTSIEGLGLYGAMREICGAKYGFWIDARPATMAWEGFTVKFFSRAGDGDADLNLDPRFTPATTATPCVSRLDLTADIEKTANKCAVYGRKLYHLSLRYLGGETPDNGTKVTLLQHGWSKSEGDLKDYAQQTNPKYVAGSTVPAQIGTWEITPVTLDKLGKTQEWHDKYTTSGINYEQNRNVFRLFVWNEAGEWRSAGGGTPAQPIYYPNTNGASFDWVYPDVKTVWGGDPVGVRKRRRMTDGKWHDNKVDSFRRIRPMLYMAIMGDDGLGPWYKVATSKYKLDEERAAIWITADDLSVWMPFDSATNDDLDLPNDQRSFATLIYQGVLRMALEGCIEGDEALLSSPAMPADSGTPFYRQYSITAGAEFVQMAEYDDGDGFVLTAPGTLVDDTADALIIANQTLDAAKDAQMHSSIMVEPDWPMQPIGKTIGTITGRNIPMRAGQSALTGRAAQIVAFRMDAESIHWELLTESAALELKGNLRRAAVERKEARKQRDTESRRAPTLGQRDINTEMYSTPPHD